MQKPDIQKPDIQKPDIHKIDASISVCELLERFPGTMAVFIQRRMLCVGCPTRSFHTLADVARIYGCSLEGLLAAINGIVGQGREDAVGTRTGRRQ